MAAMITIHRRESTDRPFPHIVGQHSLPLSLGERYFGDVRSCAAAERCQRRRLRVPNTDRPSAPPNDVPRDFMNDVTTGLFNTSPMPPPDSSDAWPRGCALGAFGAGAVAGLSSVYGL